MTENMQEGIEAQVKAYKELGDAINALEEEKKEIGQAIMQQMQGKSMQIAQYTVRKISRLSIKLSIDEARSFDAIKLEETVDKDKIKTLYHNGQQIQGVSEIEYIQITSR